MNVLGEGAFVRLVEHEQHEFAERIGCSGVVSVVAVTSAGELLLVEQYRPPLGRRTIELVAGLAGDQCEESLEAAARRELLEETGYEAGGLEFLMAGPSAGGITSAIVHYYFAPAVRPVHQGGGVAGENITVHAVPVDNVMAWLREKSQGSVLVDPKVFLGVAFATRGWERADGAG